MEEKLLEVIRARAIFSLVHHLFIPDKQRGPGSSVRVKKSRVHWGRESGILDAMVDLLVVARSGLPTPDRVRWELTGEAAELGFLGTDEHGTFQLRVEPRTYGEVLHKMREREQKDGGAA